MTIDLQHTYAESLPWRLRAPVAALRDRLMAVAAVERFFDRDASLWHPAVATQARIRERLGWLDLPTLADIAALETWVAGVRADGIRDVLVVATGGAADIARLWRDLPVSRSAASRLVVIDSIDPAGVTAGLTQLDPAHTLALLIAPHESSVAFEALSRIVAERLLGARGTTQRFVGLVAPGSPADAWVRSLGVAIHPAPADVGERWSALSRIGFMLAALAGIDLRRVADGARIARDAVLSHDPRRVGGFRLGATLGALAQHGHDLLCFDPDPSLWPLARWMRMLLAASLSKHRRGFVPILAQPAMPREDQLVIALRSLDTATPDDARPANEPRLRLIVDDAASLGAVIMTWQIGVAVAAIALGLNPFDQPDSDAFDQAWRRRLAAGARQPVTHFPALANRTPERLLRESRWVLLAGYGAAGTAATALDAPLDATVAAPVSVVRPLDDLAWATQALHAGRADGSVLLRCSLGERDLTVPGVAWTLADLCRTRLDLDLAAWRAQDRPVAWLNPR